MAIWTGLIGVLIGACVIFSGILAAASWMGKQISEARTALQEYGDALVAQQFEKAYASRDVELQRVLSEPEFEKAHELAASRNGKLEKVVLEPTQKVRDQHGMIITVNSLLVYEHAEDRFVVTMKKEGNGWFVHDARYSGK
jgi:hypothetical protein